MGLFDGLNKTTNELNDAIVALKEEIVELKAERNAQAKQTNLLKDYTALKLEVEELKISKARLVEDNEREKREVTHMVGLERKRQEFEAEQARKGIETAKTDAVLKVREENLKAEKEAFAKQMKFQQEQFDGQVKYLKGMVEQILERLPTVTVDRQISETTKRSV